MPDRRMMFAPAGRADRTPSAQPAVLGPVSGAASLDEPPQLFNVLAGSTSPAGQGPEGLFIVAGPPGLQGRGPDHGPGVAGLRQMTERKDFPLHENLEFDFRRIRIHFLMLDCAMPLRAAAAAPTCEEAC